MPHAVALVGCAIIAAGAAVLVNELVVQPHLEEQRRRRQRASAHIDEEERELRELERAIEISLREHEYSEGGGGLRRRHHRTDHSNSEHSEYSDPFCLHVAAVRVCNANARTTVQEMVTIAEEYGTVALCRCVNRSAARSSVDFEIIYESQWAATSAISALHGLILNGRALIVQQIPVPGHEQGYSSSDEFNHAQTVHQEEGEDDFPGYRPFPRAQSASLGYTPRAATDPPWQQQQQQQQQRRRWSSKTAAIAPVLEDQIAGLSISDHRTAAASSPLYGSQAQQLPEMSERHGSSSGAGIFSVKPAVQDVQSSSIIVVGNESRTVVTVDRKDPESPLDSSIEDLGADTQYGTVIEPSRAGTSSSISSASAQPAPGPSRTSPFGNIVPPLQAGASAAPSAFFFDAEQEEEAALVHVQRPVSRSSSMSSGITLISRPGSPELLAGERRSGSEMGSGSGSQSGWEDLGDISSDEEGDGSLVSRPLMNA